MSTGSKCEASQRPNNVAFYEHAWDIGQTYFLTTHKHIKLTLNLLTFDFRVLKFDLRNLSQNVSPF